MAGKIYTSDKGERYILSYFFMDDIQYWIAVSLSTGNRWADPCKTKLEATYGLIHIDFTEVK